MSAEPNGLRPDVPWLLLIGGAPAAGKSSLARALAPRYGALVCTKDELKEVLFDTLGAGPCGAAPGAAARWSRRLSDASFALLFHLAPRLLQAGRPLLLEGNFRPGEHEGALSALLEAGGARLIQILCHASRATRARRLQARAADPLRHAVHRQVSLDAGAPEPGLLALPGVQLRFDGEASAADALAALCAQLDARLDARLAS